MTETAAKQTMLQHAEEWFRHVIHAHSHRDFIVDLVREFEKLRAEFDALKAEVAVLKAKDGPLVEQVVKDVEPVVAEAVKDAEGVAADVQKSGA